MRKAAFLKPFTPQAVLLDIQRTTFSNVSSRILELLGREGRVLAADLRQSIQGSLKIQASLKTRFVEVCANWASSGKIQRAHGGALLAALFL